MSEPKRYTFEAKEILDNNGMVCSVGIATLTHPMGKFVSYEDYARLQAEVEKLRKGDERDMTAAYLYAAEQSKDEIKRLKAESARLEKQVDELTFVGDSLAVMVGHKEVTGEAHQIMLELSIEWETAKEGKQL
jgi:hypothetical protein